MGSIACSMQESPLRLQEQEHVDQSLITMVCSIRDEACLLGVGGGEAVTSSRSHGLTTALLILDPCLSIT
jgi:hypothetical protein